MPPVGTQANLLGMEAQVQKRKKQSAYPKLSVRVKQDELDWLKAEAKRERRLFPDFVRLRLGIKRF